MEVRKQVRTAAKVVIIALPIVVVLFIFAVLASTPYFNTNVDDGEIVGMTDFVALNDGSLYKFRFGLVDKDN
jgi:hypothetical protein